MYPGMHSFSFREKFKDSAYTIFDCLDETAEMGFASIEVMAGKAGAPAEHFGSDDPAHLEKVFAHAEKRGVRISCVSTFNDFAYLKDEDWRLDNIAYIQKWLGLAGQFGVPNLRMLTGYYGDLGTSEWQQTQTRTGIEQCIEAAETAGVNMAIENHNTIFFTAHDITGLIRDFRRGKDTQCATACPDPSNWGGKAFWDGDPDARADVVRQSKLIAPYMTNSHLKIKGMPTDGKLNGFEDSLEEILGAWAAAGYDGPIHFESVGDGDLLEPLPTAKDVVEKTIAKLQQ